MDIQPEPFKPLSDDLHSFMKNSTYYKKKKGELKFNSKVRTIVYTMYERIISEYFEGVLISQKKINRSKKERKNIQAFERSKLVNTLTNQIKLNFQDSFAIITQIEQGVFIGNIREINCKELENYIINQNNGGVSKHIADAKRELGCLN